MVCDGSGRPTGLLLEAAAVELVAQVMPAESFEERKARLAELFTQFARSGLTGAHVMDCGEGSLELFRALEDDLDGGLPLRLRISPWCMPGSARKTGTGSRSRSDWAEALGGGRHQAVR